MGTIERKERERKRRKDRILNAAISLIEEKGFEKTTMEEIAERAELSKGTLYLYYNDKASLYQAIKKRALQFLHDQFLEILQKDMPGAKLVHKMMLSFLDLINENTTFTKAMMLYGKKNDREDEAADHTIQEDCIQLENELLMLIVRSLQIGVQDGSIKNRLDPKLLALQIGFQMNGMIQFCLTGSNKKGLQILNENNMELPDLMEQFLQTQFSQPD
ncbi:MAG: TetR family transcriptional regulator [Bacteroidetes bacterium]|jgi:AcrR family transcriptional regulator|nr:TetR family transcriptional regulator [Bacteroidota bacterium]